MQQLAEFGHRQQEELPVKLEKYFGGIGDGKTSNTAAFWRAMSFMETWQDKGGAQLNVPRGKWVTGSFNLTSNFTLFLEEGAVILGSQGRMALKIDPSCLLQLCSDKRYDNPGSSKGSQYRRYRPRFKRKRSRKFRR